MNELAQANHQISTPETLGVGVAIVLFSIAFLSMRRIYTSLTPDTKELTDIFNDKYEEAYDNKLDPDLAETLDRFAQEHANLVREFQKIEELYNSSDHSITDLNALYEMIQEIVSMNEHAFEQLSNLDVAVEYQVQMPEFDYSNIAELYRELGNNATLLMRMIEKTLLENDVITQIITRYWFES